MQASILEKRLSEAVETFNKQLETLKDDWAIISRLIDIGRYKKAGEMLASFIRDLDETQGQADQVEAYRTTIEIKKQKANALTGNNPETVIVDLTDPRPPHCRHRLSDEGKPYPRSGCNACKMAFPKREACPHYQKEGTK